MNIEIINQNCDFDKPFLIEECADSSIQINFEFERIVTVQSKNKVLKKLITDIKEDLKKFKWLICGKVQIGLHWYLDNVQRQETDKVGDLDNISKPLLDALCGIDSILIDDSQMNSIHSTWGNKFSSNIPNIVKLKIDFINDWTVMKKNLYFLETSPIIYTPLNFDVKNLKELRVIKIFIEAIRDRKGLAKSMPYNAGQYLIYSEYEFHRTRLNGFQNHILSKEDFNKIYEERQ